jgi:hypothetical protein
MIPEIDIPEKLFVLWYWGGRWCKEGQYMNLKTALDAARAKAIWRIEERTGRIVYDEATKREACDGPRG